MSTTTQGC